MDRNELQRNAADLLFEKKRLVCQWSTGTGKSNVALQFLLSHPRTQCLIVVPEQNNIDNWKREFEKFSVPRVGVQIICYASLHKYKNTNWGLIVYDEVPHIDTKKRLLACDSINGEHILALGAVISDEEMFALRATYGKFTVSTITLEQAIKEKLLPIPEIRVLHLQLDNKEMKYLYEGARYTARGYYDRLCQKTKKATEQYNVRPIEPNRLKMLVCGSERKRFLGDMKQDALVRICKDLNKKGKRFICFCSSIAQTVKLGGEDHSFTSKSDKSMKHLQKFNDKEINSLYVVGKCIEGENLTDIDCGVIGQIGGTDRITVQEIGRVLRSDNPVIYVPIFDGTKDGSFLRTLTSSIPAKYIKHYNY